MVNARARFIYDFNIFEVIKFGQSLLEYFIFSFLVPHRVLDFFLFYLQGKRGIEKQPFQLPDFIAATGIEKIRQVITISRFALCESCFTLG